MKLTRQIALSFSVILGLVVLGFSLNLNRLFVITNSYHQIEEEWKELSHIVELQNALEQLAGILRQQEENGVFIPGELSAELPAFDGRLKKIWEDTEPLEFEEEAHGDTEEEDFSEILSEFEHFKEMFAQAGNAPGEARAETFLALLTQLHKIKEKSAAFENFNLQEMERAIFKGERARRQAIQRSIAMMVFMVLFIGAVVAWFAVLLKRSSEKAIQKEKNVTISVLAQSLAHEIRNPLGIIASAASVISKKLPPESEEQELSRHLVEEVHRIDDLLHQLLSVNHTERPPKMAETVPALIIQQVLLLLKGKCEKENIEMRYHDQTCQIPCRCDKDLVKQMMLNLLLNAIQASASGGMIDVTTRALEGTYYILVQDYGRGIPPKELKKLFDPFFTTTEEGLGIGLTVVKRILESHRGTIEVTSEPGRGTLFTIKLPQGG